jgi:hypothetical protein
MPVLLSDEEVEALRWALDNYLPQLRYESARVKLPRERHGLVAVEEALTRLRDRLDAEAARARIRAAAGGAP